MAQEDKDLEHTPTESQPNDEATIDSFPESVDDIANQRSGEAEIESDSSSEENLEQDLNQDEIAAQELEQSENSDAHSQDDDSQGQSEATQDEEGLQHVIPWSHGLEQEFDEDQYPRPVMSSVLEAILFASDEPISAARLMNIAEISSTKQVVECIDELNEKYEKMNAAFKIVQIAGGYQMMTHRIYNHWLLKLIRVRTETKLTQAALETLAIIAYKQPVIRADIEAIRGVSSGEMIRGLMQKGLVKVAGRAEILGRPMLYGTTKKFLEVFGLTSLKDLPKVEELKKPK